MSESKENLKMKFFIFLIKLLLGCFSLIIFAIVSLIAVVIISVKPYLKHLQSTQHLYHKIIWQSCQPDNLTYQWENMKIPFTYCLSIVTAGRGETPGYHLYIGAGKKADIGYSEKYYFYENSGNIEAYIRQSSTQWTPKGVTFIEKSGRQHFIPKHKFLGGR